MAIPVSLALGLANTPAHAQDVAATERLAHDAYVAAINSNDVDILMANLTADVVYQSPGEPEIVGHETVRKWVVA